MEKISFRRVIASSIATWQSFILYVYANYLKRIIILYLAISCVGVYELIPVTPNEKRVAFQREKQLFMFIYLQPNETAG